jgi:hypothetical protein
VRTFPQKASCLGRIGIFSIVIFGVSPLFGQQNSYDFSLEQKEHHVELSIQTEGFFPCLGYLIRRDVFFSDDTAIVVLRGFIRESPCPKDLGPAKTRIDLQNIDSTDFYIEFIQDSTEDFWHIKPANGQYLGKAVQNSFTTYFP